MPNRLVRDQHTYLRKMEQHFSIKLGQPIGMALAILIPFPNSLTRAKNWFVKKWNGEFWAE